jgi:hypothetical protein
MYTNVNVVETGVEAWGLRCTLNTHCKPKNPHEHGFRVLFRVLFRHLGTL